MPLILPSNSISAGGYEVDNSLRFNSGSSDSLTRTPSSASNRKTFTYSSWVKRSILTSGDQAIFNAHTDAQNQVDIYFNSNDDLIVTNRISNFAANLFTDAKFRDVSAWYHIVLAVDTTQGTAANRMKLYVNGVQETSFSEAGYPNQNTDTAVNNTVQHRIGDSNLETFFNGYIAEAVLVDGQALDPTSFGEFDEDTGIWKPIDVSGLTFGTNGFYLDFENSGSLGADVSGNGNNFTVNNLTSIDQTTDTPTNNFATLNPLSLSSALSLSEGNTKVTADSSGTAGNSFTTIPASNTGKWYWEVKATNVVSAYPRLGLADVDDPDSGTLQTGAGSDAGGTNFANPSFRIESDGDVRVAGSITGTFDSYTTNDILGFAVDMDNGACYISKNGTYMNSGDPTSGASKTGAIITWTSGTVNGLLGFCACASSASASFNFGNPSFTISSGNSDGNGYGNFEYSVPSGYYALNTKNLAEYG